MLTVTLEYGKRTHIVDKLPDEAEYSLFGETICGQYFEEERVQDEVVKEDDVEDLCRSCAREPPGWR